MAKEQYTWNKIVKIEPRLEDLYNIAKMISSEGREFFCANRIWYNLFKPRVLELVGWERAWKSSKEIVEMDLTSPTAYDIAYQKIYDALPPCKICGCA